MQNSIDTIQKLTNGFLLQTIEISGIPVDTLYFTSPGNLLDRTMTLWPSRGSLASAH